MFICPDKDYIKLQTDRYYSATGKSLSITKYDKNSETTAYFDQSGKRVAKERCENGILRAKASFDGSNILSETTFEEDGSRRKIIFSDNKKAEERIYDKEGAIKRKTVYINKIAARRFEYNEKGEEINRIEYINGVDVEGNPA